MIWLTTSPRFKGKKPIDYLFEKLDLLYPKRWKDQFASPSHVESWKQCWGEELDEMGITFEEVRVGLKRCITMYDWPPSFPEFIKSCRPSLDYERAFIEATEQMALRKTGKDRWSNPAIFWAAVKLGGDLTNFPYLAIKGRWKSALDKATEDIRNGDLSPEIPPRIKALPAPGKTTVSVGEAKKRFAEIHEILSRKVVNKAEGGGG
ncbi:replication protein P [Nitrosomonas oligotropha]|uniref:replication protein P n=1 Tax=Nitrosomonas oligotropha TaxID=42354 RepID=UPI000B7D63C2|nr:replication protein P [Nitrosomonas oligotropha]